MTRDATIYDVAARAGVSISTVSLTLNRPARVGDATRARVTQAIDDLGFVPKAAAVIHARQGLARIGVVAPFRAHNSYARRLDGVLEEMRPQDVEVVVYDEASAAATATPLQRALPLRRSLDGLVVMGLPVGESTATRLRAHRLPTVLIDTERADFSSVVTDDEHGGFLVGRHLIERGHKTIVFASESQRSNSYVSQAQRRFAGLQRAAEPDGAKVSWLRVTDDMDGGRDAVRRILSRRDRPTALFAHHDALGAGALLELRAHGLKAPDDLAVVGFDDGEIAEATAMTTVRQPLEESGRVAAGMLRALLADPATSRRRITLDLQLVVRDTT